MKPGQLIVKQLIGTLVFYLVIFISAGRINYWQGWVYTVIGIFMTLISFTVLRMSQELMDERSKPGIGVK